MRRIVAPPQMTRIAVLLLFLGIAVATFQIQHVYSTDHSNANTCELCQVPSFDQALTTSIELGYQSPVCCQSTHFSEQSYLSVIFHAYQPRAPPTQV